MAPQAQAAQQSKNEKNVDHDLDEAKRLLDDILNRTGRVNARSRIIIAALDERIEQVRDVLPDALKGQAERLVRRAVMYFNSNPDLAACPPADFVRAVVRAAELGLALDGKLCYCVKYKSSWQVAPDYKGLVVVAKRSGQIVDVKPDIVHALDHFRYEHRNGLDTLEHVPMLSAPNRGEIIGAYASFLLPGGLYRAYFMTYEDLNKIRDAAPSKNGPWASWPKEMMKKCPIRRGLKLYCDDPAVLAALDLDVEEETAFAPSSTVELLPPGKTSLRGIAPAAPRQAAREPEPETGQQPEAEEPAESAAEQSPAELAPKAEEPKPAAKKSGAKGKAGPNLSTLKYQIREHKIHDGRIMDAMCALGLIGDSAENFDLDALSEEQCRAMTDELAKPVPATEGGADGLFKGESEAHRERR